MSNTINTATVQRVLLVDGWHDVANTSFVVDSCQYVHDGAPVVAEITSAFSFTDSRGHQLCGPLSAIQAMDSTPWQIT